MGDDELLDTAIAYASQHWHVLPLDVKGKRPVGRLVPQAFKDASDDPEQLQEWWSEGDWNIGIAVQASRLVVLDIDDPGFDYSVYPRTLTARTGGDHQGHHLYYLAPEQDVHLPGKLMHKDRHVGEIKANGYVVAPPSRVLSEYEWVDKHRPAPFPIDMFPKRETFTPRETLNPLSGSAAQAFAKGVLAKAVGRIRVSDHGEHNNTIYSEAVWVFGLVKAKQLDHSVAYDHMYYAAVDTGHDPARVVATLSSAYDGAREWVPEESVREAPTQVNRTTPLLDEADLDRVEPPKMLLPDRLPEGLSLLFGQYGAAKSTVAVDWGLTLTALGFNVLYCVGEDTVGLAARVRAWRRAHQELQRNGRFVVAEGENFPHLDDAQSVMLLKQNIEETEAHLVVVDVYGLALGGDENTENTKAAVRVFKDIVNNGCSMLIIHHEPTTPDGSPALRSRGSGHLENSSDCVIQASKPPASEVFGRYWLTWHKMKNVRSPRPLDFGLAESGESVMAFPPTPLVLGLVDRDRV